MLRAGAALHWRMPRYVALLRGVSLVPVAPLNQVVFIHDYFQLVFQDASFSIYNEAEIRIGMAVFGQQQPGFSDKLIGLIGKTLTAVSTSPSLALTFENGAVVVVSQTGCAAEAWQYKSAIGEVVVEQNA